MKEFRYEELIIKIEEDDNEIRMNWLGRSRGYDLTKVLISYLDGLAGEVKGKKLKIDFTKLEMFSSSTVPVIIKLIKDLDDIEVKTEILYNAKLHWQNASFKALESIMELFSHIEIKNV